MSRSCDKWTAFLVSLAIPGAGQLLSGSWSGLVWLAGAATLAIVYGVAERHAATMLLLPIGAASVLTALGSAEHAKRRLEPSRRGGGKPCRQGKTAAWRRSSRCVAARTSVATPYPVAQLWQRVSNLPQFLTIDPFHEQVALAATARGKLSDLLLAHNAFGFRFLRQGRVLRWHEGRGYSLSDLSSRGHQRGFPHVFHIRIEPLEGPGSIQSILTIDVRGKWTIRWIPAYLGTWWLYYVCRDHARLLAKSL